MKRRKRQPAGADARPTVPAVPPALLPQEQTRPFITVVELQQKLPVSRRTIFAWRKAGWLPSIQNGAKILFHWPSVEAALLRRQLGGVA